MTKKEQIRQNTLAVLIRFQGDENEWSMLFGMLFGGFAVMDAGGKLDIDSSMIAQRIDELKKAMF